LLEIRRLDRIPMHLDMAPLVLRQQLLVFHARALFLAHCE
jgi:hypothetical protein